MKDWKDSIAIVSIGVGAERAFAVADVSDRLSKRVLCYAGFRDVGDAADYRKALLSGETTALLRLRARSEWTQRWIDRDDDRFTIIKHTTLKSELV